NLVLLSSRAKGTGSRAAAYIVAGSRRQEGGVGNQRQSQDIDTRGTGTPQGTGAGAHRRPGRNDIVDEHDPGAGEISAGCHREGSGNVLPALLATQTDLRRGAAAAAQHQGREANTGAAAHLVRQNGRLIEAARDEPARG